MLVVGSDGAQSWVSSVKSRGFGGPRAQNSGTLLIIVVESSSITVDLLPLYANWSRVDFI